MKIAVKKSKLNGKIAVPGSKSHTIRAIVAALMADGTSTIHAPLHSADTISTLKAAEKMGAQIIEFSHDLWKIRGCSGKLKYCSDVIDMGNSGTGLRLLSAMAAVGNSSYTFDGDESLRSRPMRPLLNALEELGANVKANNSKCPFSIQGPLLGGEAVVEAVSSQFLSALLFCCPFAKAESKLDLSILNERPYVGITLDWLKRLGVKYQCREDWMYFRVPGLQHFKAFEYTIPADFSTAAFPLGAACLCGEEVEILNLDFDDVQGDKAVFDYVRQMGAQIQTGQQVIVSAQKNLGGVDIDLNATPDALPLMAVLGALSQNVTRLLNVPQARLKETDRIKCMTTELRKMGAQIEELADGMVIYGGELHGCELESYQDHRIVMALAVAAMNAQGTTIINDAEAAAVTYPDFVSDFRRLGAQIEIME